MESTYSAGASFWAFAAVTVVFLYLHEVLSTTQLTRNSLPLVGSPSKIIPKSILNFIFAVRGLKVLDGGFTKFKDRAFQFIRNDGPVHVLPPSLLEELSGVPNNIASRNGALEHDLLGHYTGISLIVDSRLHHTIVQRKLTPRLEQMIPGLEEELTAAFEEHMPASKEEWTEFEPYQALAKISARLSARALVGPELCRDETWLDVSVNFTESLFRTIVVLRFLPAWTHPIVSKLLPSYWHGRGYLRKGQNFLGPIFKDLLKRHDEGTWKPDNTKDADAHMLSWLVESAKGIDRDPKTLAHIEVLLALASVHTTLLRMVNTLYDLTSNPSYFAELREEIASVQEKGWTSTAYSKLLKTDSVLRESQRMSPPTILGMKRIFQQPYTFSNGLSVPAGAYVCMATYAIENDPLVTPSPEKWDGLRSYRKRLSDSSSKGIADAKNKTHSFSAFDKTVLNFGYGKTACPGRFFADIILKMVLVKMVQQYEFRFPGDKGRPENIVLHEFLFTWPWDKMLVRRREAECPF